MNRGPQTRVQNFRLIFVQVQHIAPHFIHGEISIMITMRYLGVVIAVLFCALCAQGQSTSRLETLFGIPAKNKPASPLPPLQGFQDCIRDGKLILSLDDAIRLALANNTDIRLDQSAIDTARDSVLRAFHPFDPVVISSFNDQRSEIPAFQELQGAPVLNTLSQTAQFSYNQTFETGP